MIAKCRPAFWKCPSPVVGFTHHKPYNGCYHEPKHTHNGAFTLDVKSMLNENLGGILGGTRC
jgi:hypothetical protein